MPNNIAWRDVDTVLLDMDGTLLDLAFDRVFWQQIVPDELSRQRQISRPEAVALLQAAYQEKQHTLNWYCLDYWSERLSLDIRALTTRHGPNAKLRADTAPFLAALKAQGKRRILLTNAHPHNLEVKLAHTGLDEHLDLLLSTHTFGYPKEESVLWQEVTRHTGMAAERTLFIDDSEQILDAATQFGIRYCLGVSNPDSGLPDKHYQRHQAIGDYRLLIPGINEERP